MNELKQLLKAIERLESIVDINKDFMDADDLGDLMNNIEGLKAIYHSTYKKQLRQFCDYLSDESLTSSSDDFTKWTETPYIITHGDKSVVIDNYADVYEELLCMLENHYNDMA